MRLTLAIVAMLIWFTNFECIGHGASLAAESKENIQSFEIIHRIELPDGAMSVAWTPDGSKLVAVSANADVISVWDASDWHLIRAISREGYYASNSLVVLPGETVLTSASSSDAPRGRYALTLFDLNDGSISRKIPTPPTSSGPLRVGNSSMLFAGSSHGKLVAMAILSAPEKVFVYDTQNWMVVGEISLPPKGRFKKSPMSLSFSSDENYLAIGSLGGFVYVFDAHTGEMKLNFRAYPEKSYMGVGAIAVIGSDHFIATGAGLSSGGRKSIGDPIRIFRFKTGQQLSTFGAGGAQTFDLSWDASTNLLGAGFDRTLRTWRFDPSSGLRVVSTESLPGAVFAERFSSTGMLAAVAGHEIIILK